MSTKSLDNRDCLSGSLRERERGRRRRLLSNKGDYGVRALIDLAKHEGAGPVQRAEIARRRQIPESYLDHLLAQLRRAGFVRSVRGPGGGHMLARPAEEICLLHVLEALEGSLAPLAWLDKESAEEAICGQEWVWQEIYDNRRGKLAGVSIAALVDHEREHGRTATANYIIGAAQRRQKVMESRRW